MPLTASLGLVCPCHTLGKVFVPCLLVASLQLDPQVQAAYGVLQRTIGPRAKEFRLFINWPTSATDRFEIQTNGGRVTVKATSGVALCRGTYEYLKDKCNSFVSWEGSNIRLPKRLPDDKRSGSCPVKYRQYYNICTFGYTTAFWDWPRWQREIDWMALHGINMPLALTGQDKVWQTVFRSYGVPQTSLDGFFSGPAFQPWHWMGNLNGHGGPAPQSWLDGQSELQKKILGRERSLGMKPVVPGFSGFVPVDFAEYQPRVKLQSPTAWCGFAPTTFVDIRDPMFVEIGKRFVQEYRRLYGADHLYLCDTFNEQNPQFPATTKLEDLANAGRSVYEGLRQADPSAIWVMQGWLFYNAGDYWKGPEVEALLSKVPDGRMIILDLSCEQYEVWRAQPAVAKKGFIYCTLHNFGQNTGLGGDLQGYADKQYLATARSSPFDDRIKQANLVGYGLTPEGIDTNPIVYELMTDVMWTTADRYMNGRLIDSKTGLPTEPMMDISRWLGDYASARYGQDLAQTRQAWALLDKALYSQDSPWYHDSWRSRPGRAKRGRPIHQMREIEQALALMLKAAPKLRGNPLFQRDLVDVCKTWLGGIADRELYAANQTLQDKPSEYALHKADFFGTLDDIDRVMATRTEHRLTTWLNQAGSWGTTPAEKRLMERNARLQITAWDGRGVLTDYANKEWAGLTRDFIARRWRLYFDKLEARGTGRTGGTDNANDYLKLEMAWINSATPPEESNPGDPARTVAEIFAKHKGELEILEKALGLTDPPGNIARNGTAGDDGHTEPGGSPQNAIDGDMDSYWAAHPYPCVWRLDLKSVHNIKTIHVFPYWGDGRYYQYTIEVSTDGKSWTRVVDMSKNEQPSSPGGQKHILDAPSAARYLRINMLKNSANVGVHLVEVRVYEK
ncbi:MAG: alpha-N-acetylglucosaminidase TIM-barrel domain-containing protein [Fimbriimonadales bacterium]